LNLTRKLIEAIQPVRCDDRHVMVGGADAHEKKQAHIPGG